jgi:protein involved in polysaccharide export with SLBB domain
VLDLGMKGAGTRSGRRNRLATTMLAFSACVAMLPAAWGRQQGQQQAGTQSPSQNQSQTQNQQTRAQGQSSSGRALWLKLSSADPVAAQNLDQVAASTSEIRTVLTQNPGLMIELKRLLALRATERGQILAEDDLTNQAVYDKLDSDLKFRSAATLLLQRYGYLMPEVNPMSELGQEQQILIKQRALQLAQLEQQQGMTASQPQTQATGTCNPPQISGCLPSPSNSAVPGGVSPLGSMPSYAYPPTTQPSPTTPSVPNSGIQEILTSLPGGAGSSATLSQLGSLATTGGGGLSPSMTGASASALARGVAGAGGLGQAASMLGASDGRSQLSSLLGATQQFSELSYPGGGNEAFTGSGAQPAIYNPNQMAPGANGTGIPNPYGPYGWWNRQPYQEQPPQLVARENPFSDIPSLYDMYMQAAQQTIQPERFGLQVFRDTTASDQVIPMDLPVGPSYVVGPGDGLTIDLWGGVSQRLFRMVDRTGRVALPEVGPVLVSGETLGQVQETVQRLLRTQFRNVSADVSVTRLKTVRVYVVGDVEHPGAYDVSSLSTPLNAEFAAGGPTQNGSLRVVQHWRGDKLLQSVDVYDLLLHGVTTDILPLAEGDTVRVPTVGPQVTVEGMVRRPDIYELRDEKTLAAVIRLTGGILPAATLKHIEVDRLVAHEKRTMLSLNIPDNATPAVVETELAAFHVQDDDIVHVFPMAPYNQDAVYVEGHVLRPGKYAFHPGMKLSDLITSYKDLLPQPSSYAEIIRLEPPDFRPVVESFNLERAMKDPAASPKLDPLDTVRIYSQYDFQDVPTVSVGGAVRQPGLYRTSGRVHLRDALELAGGVTPDASMGAVQVYHYLPNSEMKVLSVGLDKVLSGDPLDNILLGPRDSVLVNENLARSDPATVYVEGEVAHPGRYPLAVGMRVSELVQVAGGLNRSADQQSADLTRYDWSNPGQIAGQHVEIGLTSALRGNPNADVPLRNGDVLTVRQVAGWSDLGASIEIKGEVKHPGRYGIKPGETLSSVLERAGGFTSHAYPYGALLERKEVRALQMKSYEDLITRVRQSQDNVLAKIPNAPDQDTKLYQEAAYAQWQMTLNTLIENPPLGRVVVRISPEIHRWSHSAEDIQVRAGDTLIIPKRPSSIMVQGQVYNPTAVAFMPGKSAKWYLSQAGGATNMANKKAIFVIRANGSVVGAQGFSLWSGNPLDTTLYPGDTVVVPEKAVGGPPQWKTIFQSAQIISSIVTSAVLVAHYY